MHAKLDSFIEVEEKNPFYGAVTFGIKTLIINSHCSYPKYKYEEEILTLYQYSLVKVTEIAVYNERERANMHSQNIAYTRSCCVGLRSADIKARVFK
jgi:hypothetical protein